jgi:hypothetical protein
MALTGLLAANNLSDIGDIEKTWDNIGNNISATVFVPSPSLDLNFAVNKSLIDNISGNNLITFARASTGTFVGSNGLIQAAASGVPRFDHNPATGESLGLLVEEARTNYFTYSESFSNAAWSKTANISATDASIISPDGNMSGALLATTATGNNYIYRNTNTDTQYCSFFAKAGSTGNVWARIYTYAFGRVVAYNFNLNNGTFSAATGNTGNLTGWNEYISITKFSNGWYRIGIGVGTSGGAAQIELEISPSLNGSASASGESVYIWGAQWEGAVYFPTSYIPTTSSIVTRAADTASITGSNFSSWYRQDEGTMFIKTNNIKGLIIAALTNAFSDQIALYGTTLGTPYAQFFGNIVSLGQQWNMTKTSTDPSITAFTYKANDASFVVSGGSASTDTSNVLPTPDRFVFCADVNGSGKSTGTIARLAFYPVRLPDRTLQALTTYGPVSSFPYSFSIKGKDILALKEVNKTSTRDFIFIKGLSSKAQPRITTASQYTTSGVALRNVAMLRNAPTTSGNYFFSSGLTLSGTTVQINGTSARSIATSPFSGSTATAPLLFAGLKPQTNWRITEPMASGTLSFPEFAIPIETNDFLLFMKAGQG